MSILVVGSMGLDSVKTPFGQVQDALGGSATYFSVSASYFTQVNLVGVVGTDFPQKHVALLKRHHIDVAGLQTVPGKTFRWKGHYMNDINQAETLKTELNVFAGFRPELPKGYENNEYVFLANIDPELQLRVLKQVKKPKLIAADTMNFWITGKLPQLKKTLRHVDILLINEGEARQLSGATNLVTAAKKVCALGPRAVVIKRGEYGALFVSGTEMFACPAYPLEKVADPTGAGDTFAGGFMGALAQSGKTDTAAIRRAMVYGAVMASYNVQGFSLSRLDRLSSADIKKRWNGFKKLTAF